MKLITICSTYPNKTEAKKIASYLLKKKLISCAKFFPIESMFWWNDKINNAKEITALFTAKDSHWNEVKNIIKKMHSYEVPCIEKVQFIASKDYEDWIKDATTK